MEDAKRKGGVMTNLKTLKTLQPQTPSTPTGLPVGPGGKKEWEVLLSESSGSDTEDVAPRKARILEKSVCDKKVALKEHDYCFAAFQLAREIEKPKEDLSEMDKILSNVALGAFDPVANPVPQDLPEKTGLKTLNPVKKHKKAKKKKKKRKKHKKNKDGNNSSSSSDSEAEVDVTSTSDAVKDQGKSGKKVKRTWMDKPKYHLGGSSQNQGVTAAAARPHFSSSEGEDEDLTSNGEMASSDYDTDFSADEKDKKTKRAPKLTPKAVAFAAETSANEESFVKVDDDEPESEMEELEVEDEAPETPSLKLKIKLPSTPKETTPKPQTPKLTIRPSQQHWGQKKTTTPKTNSHKKSTKRKYTKSSTKLKIPTGQSLSKKMRPSFTFSGTPKRQTASESSDYESDGYYNSQKSNIYMNGNAGASHATSASAVAPSAAGVAGNSNLYAALPPIDTKLYCVCQSPHDDVSEMIGCDAPDCKIEWFHFECVGIMVPPEGQWYCPECTKRYNIRVNY